MKAPIRVSVTMPCLNEAANVRRTVTKAIEALQRLVTEFEILVVDDGSRDDTADIARAVAAEHSRVRVLRHETNRGYGAAVRTGLMASQFEWRFFTDGDGQFDMKELERLLPFVNEADLICGYRIRRRDPWQRSLFAFCFNRVVRLCFGLKMRDLNCAFKLIRADVLESCPLTSDSSFANSEVLIQAKEQGYRLVEVGVHHHPRQAGVQTGAGRKMVLGAFGDLYRMKRRRHKRGSNLKKPS